MAVVVPLTLLAAGVGAEAKKRAGEARRKFQTEQEKRKAVQKYSLVEVPMALKAEGLYVITVSKPKVPMIGYQYIMDAESGEQPLAAIAPFQSDKATVENVRRLKLTRLQNHFVISLKKVVL